MERAAEEEDFHYRRIDAPRPRVFGLALVSFAALVLFVLFLPRRAIPSDAVAPPFSALAPVLASTTPATSTAALAAGLKGMVAMTAASHGEVLVCVETVSSELTA